MMRKGMESSKVACHRRARPRRAWAVPDTLRIASGGQPRGPAKTSLMRPEPVSNPCSAKKPVMMREHQAKERRGSSGILQVARSRTKVMLRLPLSWMTAPPPEQRR